MSGCPPVLEGSHPNRQADCKRGAKVLARALGPYAAAVELHEGADDRQPQPQSAKISSGAIRTKTESSRGTVGTRPHKQIVDAPTFRWEFSDLSTGLGSMLHP